MLGLIVVGFGGFIAGILVPKDKAKEIVRGWLRKLNNKVKEV